MTAARGEFVGKAVFLTGAASGLGRAAAVAFAREGAAVTLLDFDEKGLTATAQAVEAAGASVLPIVADLADVQALSGHVARAVEVFGGLDALCNIAGMCRFDHAATITPDIWDRIFAVNLRAPFFLIQAALPHLLAREGAVVNVASASAFQGTAYLAHYAASKAALVSMTKTLAMEYSAAPIRINALAPGGIASGMAATMHVPDGADLSLIGRYSGLRGVSEPEDFCEALLLLAGPRGRVFHGACLNADRGVTAG